MLEESAISFAATYPEEPSFMSRRVVDSAAIGVH
jgi:hypothetical protein